MEAQWKVLPHGPIEVVSERLRVVEGSLPGMPLKRVMSAVKLDDGTLVIHSAIALDPSTQKELEAWGRPRILLVPCAWHRLDAPAYKTRHPSIAVFCPEGAREKVGKEGYLELADDAGVTLIFNDAVFNQPHLPGSFGFVYKLIGSSGGPRVPPLVRVAMVRDKRALRAHLERLADTPQLRRVVMSHGARVEHEPGAFLRQVAATL